MPLIVTANWFGTSEPFAIHHQASQESQRRSWDLRVPSNAHPAVKAIALETDVIWEPVSRRKVPVTSLPPRLSVIPGGMSGSGNTPSRAARGSGPTNGFALSVGPVAPAGVVCVKRSKDFMEELDVKIRREDARPRLRRHHWVVDVGVDRVGERQLEE